MYIVEELAIHWNIEEHTMVGAHMFFAVAISSFVTNSIVQATSDAGTIDFNSIIIYDHTTSEVYRDVYKYNDIPWFLLLAGLCGIFGGVYTRVAIAINTVRSGSSLYKHWCFRLADCVLVANRSRCIMHLARHVHHLFEESFLQKQRLLGRSSTLGRYRKQSQLQSVQL